MKNAAYAALPLIFAGHGAAADTLAGAVDGMYRAKDGSFIRINAASAEIGIQLLSCEKPVVSAGRLKSARCLSNGHAGGDIDVTWLVANGAIYSEGKRYLPLPPLLPLPQLGKPDPFGPTPDAWTHNDSGVKLDRKTGLITYTIPKTSLRDVVKPGSIIFEEGVGTNGFVIGMA